MLKWGDEVEYMIIKFDDEKQTARVSLKALEMLDKLQEKEISDPSNVKSLWRPEYAAYMIEGTPGKPYGGLLSHFNLVESSMKYRREEAAKLLNADETVMSITSFPRLGCPQFSHPPFNVTPADPLSAAQSLFYPDDVIFSGHPRFKNLTRNIRMRRGEKVCINVPVYKDEKTKYPIENALPETPDHVYMDAMGFGMGCSCLQLTFQACNINEARYLYDQLTPLCPIMLALTAASPIYRGHLTDIDCRWNVISASVDCRTAEERGLKPLSENKFRIFKSRYDSIDCYLSEGSAKYNDVPLIYNEEDYQTLRDGGIDHQLAQHIAHLFIRDSVSLFSEKVNQDDCEETDHFENIQSTNWQTMRFKPPPPGSSIGWRVEFRPCELQLTDFENAAIVVFIVLLTRVILSFRLNFLIPISKVDENMQKAQKRNAVLGEKFWFRRHCSKTDSTDTSADDECELWTINEIINGKDNFPGLISYINQYLSSMDVDTDTHCSIQQYLKLIQRRASGNLLTTASWIRKEVLTHPDYK